MLNGAVFEPTDPKGGTKLVPITYKGIDGFAIRGEAEAAGIPVTWDGEQPERLRLRELGTGRIIGLNWASRVIKHAQKIA